MRRRPLLFMSVVALGIGMVTSVGIVKLQMRAQRRKQLVSRKTFFRF